MREIQILAWCDMCWLDGERKTPSTRMLRLSIAAGVRPQPVKEIEFCDEHGATIVPLISVYDAAALPDGTATVPRASAPAAPAADDEHPARRVCPICDNDYSSTAQTVGHIMKVHRAGESPYPDLKCPYCGKVCGAPQSIARHLMDVHNVDLIARAAEPVLARARMMKERTA